MKSTLLGVCLSILTVASLANAKTTTTTTTTSYDRGPIWVGLGIGPNFSTFTSKPSDSLSGNTNFHIGAYGDYQIRDMWWVESGLRYNSYGFGTGSFSYNAHYLEIPALIKPTFDMGGWSVYAVTGPMFGFNVGESSGDAAKTFDLSWDIGGGAQYPVMPNLKVFAQLEFDLGITDAIKYGDGSSGASQGVLMTFGALASF